MGAPEAGTVPQDQMDACAAAGAIGPEHELLKQFEGAWKAQVKIWFDPAGDPQVSTGVMTNALVLGGRFLEHRYEDDSGMFQGRGYWGYNTTDGRWEGLWIDSMATYFQVEHGAYDADAKRWVSTSTMTDPMSKTPMKKRSVVTVHGPDSHTMEMYFRPLADGGAGPETKAMEIAYTRSA